MNTRRMPVTGLLGILVVVSLFSFASCQSKPASGMADRAKEAPRTGASRDEAPMPLLPAEGGRGGLEAEEAPASPAVASRSDKAAKSADAFMESADERAYDAESASPASSGPREGGLQAGLTDDHRQYNYFIDFLAKYRDQVSVRDIPVDNRVTIELVDREGRPFPNAELRFTDAKGTRLDTVMTNADGRSFVTLDKEAGIEAFTEGRSRLKAAFDPQGPRSVRLELPLSRTIPNPPPLDVVFILDTTGSMGGEIERLRTTIDIIRENLDLAKPRPLIRFGLVLYKDEGDEYVSRVYPLTGDMKEFRKNLSYAEASGGGDTPEDLEKALKDALGTEMGWNDDGGRIAFIITDAPAQMYRNAVPYTASAEVARSLGIRVHSIGTGGLPLQGEYQLRQIAWRTRGSYIFLTYGERGESAGGKPGAVSHHTGDNWTAERLETIIIRLARDELAALSGTRPSVPADDWFKASKDSERSDEDVLDELFRESMTRLVDYASFKVSPETPVSLASMQLPEGSPAVYSRNAERFHARLLQIAVSLGRFKLVERENLQAVLDEVELALSAAAANKPAANLVELLGSEFLILPELREVEAGGDWEVYLRLVRVRTAEILSVSRARIDRELALK